MNKTSALYTIALAAVALVFLLGLYQVLLIPLHSGHAWTPYSSYRSDPLGLSVLHNALASQQHLEVQRNELSLMQVREGAGKTLLLAGVTDSSDIRLLIEAMEQFVQSGGRLVITYLPAISPVPPFWEEMQGNKDEEAEEKTESGEEAEEDDAETAPPVSRAALQDRLYVNIRQRWGFELDVSPDSPSTSEDEDHVLAQRAETAPAELPPAVLWRARTILRDLADHWRVLYTRDSDPVLIERTWEAGSIVIATDTYFLSNEAMQEHRYPELLGWLIGPNHTIVFDETHLGISRDPGIVALMRRYRFTPLIFSIVLVALLFVWKASSSLVPRWRPEEAQPATLEAGKPASAGLSSLLRRSIPEKALLNVCQETWRQDCGRTPGAEQFGRELAQWAAQPAGKVPLDKIYNTMAAKLKERKRK